MKNPKLFRTAFNTYSATEKIGEGGCGVVHKVKDERGEFFAIKSLDLSKASKEKMKRFKNEYLFCAKNKHPNIITVLENGLNEDQSPFFVMPLYDGSIRSIVGKLQPRDALNVFEKILDGVEAAHKLGVTHRDLKPENILSSDKSKELVIADFGIARFEEDDIYTAVETREGTRLANFQYAAPEQRVRGRAMDHRADIYALGLILNELFTGELALGTNFKTISSVTADYPYLDALVDRMLQQDPAARFQEIEEIKKELIARGEQHVSLQKINSLKDTVIPVGELDDPLVSDPIRVVDGEWDNGILKITLNRPVNDNWLWALGNMGGHTSVLGKGPESFRFIGNVAQVSADTHEAQQIIDYFKQWLPQANQVYVHKLKSDIKKSEHKQQAELQAKIKAEEEKLRMKQSLRF